ncbi:MAG: MBL fold metallo-hydrolase [Clostridiales bacterium]|jgi:7,8-dihydropterin-6-yl-methyl-4-(beta-D-ribofuranosyl)aminobenzene 5'-phosphate synthase|nr:MBL fold metallo-hydrolase [Clostridiales bacterium]
MDKKEIAKKIFNTAYINGEFILRSGKISNEYFDKYLFEAEPELLVEIAKIMNITALVENTTNDDALKTKHGLSIYIETAKHKILFDVGPNDAFIYNAKQLGIDLAEIDIFVLSHGHSDHGGALSDFLRVNDKAKIYIHKKAFEPYFIEILFAKKYIGLDKKLAANERIIFTDGVLEIDDELLLFSDVEGQFDTKSHRVLLRKTQNGFERDDFLHEQNLIVTSGGKSALFSGCSHRGIANILRAATKHRAINAVFGGFHLYNPVTKAAESPQLIEELATELSSHETIFYTCHCTGEKAYQSLREIMGEKVRYFSTGTTVKGSEL